MTLGRAPLGITEPPFEDHELDNHPDRARIWATVEKLREEFEDRLDELVNQIASEFELDATVNDDGFIELSWACPEIYDNAETESTDKLDDELDKIAKFVNMFGFGKAINNLISKEGKENGES